MGENKGYIKNTDEKGSVSISEDVVAVIAATAAMEVEGINSLFPSHGKELTDVISKKALSRGVKMHIEEDKITIDVHIIATIGYPVNEVGAEIQKAIKSAVEATIGVTVSAVNVHICGVSLKKKK